MGQTFDNLNWDTLCDLMCGGPEEDEDEDFDSDDDTDNAGWERPSECRNKINNISTNNAGSVSNTSGDVE